MANSISGEPPLDSDLANAVSATITGSVDSSLCWQAYGVFSEGLFFLKESCALWIIWWTVLWCPGGHYWVDFSLPGAVIWSPDSHRYTRRLVPWLPFPSMWRVGGRSPQEPSPRASAWQSVSAGHGSSRFEFGPHPRWWVFLQPLTARGIPTGPARRSWISVISAGRRGRRIPIGSNQRDGFEPAISRAAFPRGAVDLCLRTTKRVVSASCSESRNVVADDQQHYSVRGLSQATRTLVRRFEGRWTFATTHVVPSAVADTAPASRPTFGLASDGQTQVPIGNFRLKLAGRETRFADSHRWSLSLTLTLSVLGCGDAGEEGESTEAHFCTESMEAEEEDPNALRASGFRESAYGAGQDGSGCGTAACLRLLTTR